MLVFIFLWHIYFYKTIHTYNNNISFYIVSSTSPISHEVTRSPYLSGEDSHLFPRGDVSQ